MENQEDIKPIDCSSHFAADRERSFLASFPLPGIKQAQLCLLQSLIFAVFIIRPAFGPSQIIAVAMCNVVEASQNAYSESAFQQFALS
jgi:hypothetical protein